MMMEIFYVNTVQYGTPKLQVATSTWKEVGAIEEVNFSF